MSQDFDFFQVERRKLPIYLLLDCSQSMQDEHIKALNYAVRAMIPPLRDMAESNPEASVQLRAIRFDDTASWVGPAAPVEEAEWDDLAAGGLTSLGAALILLAEELAPDRMEGSWLPPLILLVSDGQPTDDYEAGFAAMAACPVFQDHALRFAVAIGANADRTVLKRFVSQGTGDVLEARDAGELANRIRWASSVGVRSIAVGKRLDDLPPPTNDPFIWDA